MFNLIFCFEVIASEYYKTQLTRFIQSRWRKYLPCNKILLRICL